MTAPLPDAPDAGEALAEEIRAWEAEHRDEPDCETAECIMESEWMRNLLARARAATRHEVDDEGRTTP